MFCCSKTVDDNDEEDDNRTVVLSLYERPCNFCSIDARFRRGGRGWVCVVESTDDDDTALTMGCVMVRLIVSSTVASITAGNDAGRNIVSRGSMALVVLVGG